MREWLRPELVSPCGLTRDHYSCMFQAGRRPDRSCRSRSSGGSIRWNQSVYVSPSDRPAVMSPLIRQLVLWPPTKQLRGSMTAKPRLPH